MNLTDFLIILGLVLFIIGAAELIEYGKRCGWFGSEDDDDNNDDWPDACFIG